MDAVAQLGAENVVDQAVLGDSGHALKGGSRDDRVEVVTVAGDLGDGAGNPGLDP
jgi:hypothetical protein